MNYRISCPLRQPLQIIPEMLQESDFIRWGAVTQLEEGVSYQNAKLHIPVRIVKGQEEHLYPIHSYIRVFTNGKAQLISKYPLP